MKALPRVRSSVLFFKYWRPLVANTVQFFHSYLIGRNTRKICTNVRPVSESNFKVKQFLPFVSGQNFPPRGGKFRWVFGKGPIKGCLQTFEELSQKYTLVLPQAKCRETKRYFCSLSASSSKGFGETFSERRFPRVPRISRFSAQRHSLREDNILPYKPFVQVL